MKTLGTEFLRNLLASQTFHLCYFNSFLEELHLSQSGLWSLHLCLWLCFLCLSLCWFCCVVFCWKSFASCSWILSICSGLVSRPRAHRYLFSRLFTELPELSWLCKFKTNYPVSNILSLIFFQKGYTRNQWNDTKKGDSNAFYFDRVV